MKSLVSLREAQRLAELSLQRSRARRETRRRDPIDGWGWLLAIAAACVFACAVVLAVELGG